MIAAYNAIIGIEIGLICWIFFKIGRAVYLDIKNTKKEKERERKQRKYGLMFAGFTAFVSIGWFVLPYMPFFDKLQRLMMGG